MFIIAQRKKSVVLLAMMMHMSAYGITEFQAKFGAVLAGTLALAGSSMVSNYDTPGIGVVGLGAAGLSYAFLQQYTTRAQLAHIDSELNKVTYQGYGNSWIPEGDELRPFREHAALFKSDQLKPKPGDKDYEDYIFQIKRDSVGNGEHALAVAYEEMIPLHSVVNKCTSLLKSILNDALADQLSETWDETYNRCENYSNELKTVDMWIREHPSFAKENESYLNRKERNELLKISKQKADAKTKKAVAATVAAQAKVKKAQAEEKKADAVQSYTSLQWLKFIVRLFGIKWD
jgi:hypothetical protein